MHHGDRAIGAVMRQQLRDDARQMLHAEVDGQGRTVAGQGAQLLPRRHRRVVTVAREDHRLRHLRQGQLGLQQRRAGRRGGNAGDDLEGNLQRTQLTNLLANGAVQRGVAGMYAGHVLAPGVSFGQQRDDLLQMQLGGVHHLLGTVALQHGLGHQRAGIEDHRAAADQALALDGDQLGIAGAGTDEIDGHERFRYQARAIARVAAALRCLGQISRAARPERALAPARALASATLAAPVSSRTNSEPSLSCNS